MVGVSIAFPDGCYSDDEDNLVQIAGTEVSNEDCYQMCLVSVL